MYSRRKVYNLRIKRQKQPYGLHDFVWDNIFFHILAYILFYAALYYANKIVQRVEKMNEQLWLIVNKNNANMDVIADVKNLREEYDKTVMEAKRVQNQTMDHLDNETARLTKELADAESKVDELEETLAKLNPSVTVKGSTKIIRESNGVPEAVEDDAKSIDYVKVLEPSFPPPEPVQPVRKYGIKYGNPKMQIPYPKKEVATN